MQATNGRRSRRGVLGLGAGVGTFLLTGRVAAPPVAIPRARSGETQAATDSGAVGDGAAEYRLAAAETSTGGGGAIRPSRPPIKWITTFQAGHGWVNEGLAEFTDDTTDYAMGTQSVRARSLTASWASIGRTGLSINARNNSFVITLKVGDASKVKVLNFYAGAADFSWYYMWTIQDAPATGAQQYFKSGEYATIVLNFADAAQIGRVNRGAITRLRLGFGTTDGQSSTCNWQAVGLTPDQTRYPDGLVSISFDDGYSSIYSQGRPALDVHGFTATSYLICDRIDTAGYKTLEECRRLEEVNGWDMAAHAHTVADHDAGFASMSEPQLDTALAQLRGWLDERGFRGARHLAYPLGDFSPTVDRMARKYFETARSVICRTAAETLPPAGPHRMRSWSVTSSHMPARNVTGLLDKAKAQKAWLHLTFHNIIPSGTPGPNDILYFDFATIVTHIASIGMPVRTVREVLTGL